MVKSLIAHSEPDLSPRCTLHRRACRPACSFAECTQNTQDRVRSSSEPGHHLILLSFPEQLCWGLEGWLHRGPPSAVFVDVYLGVEGAWWRPGPLPQADRLSVWLPRLSSRLALTELSVSRYTSGRPSDASNEKAIGMRHLSTSKFDESTLYMRKPCHTGRTARGVPLSFSTMQGT